CLGKIRLICSILVEDTGIDHKHHVHNFALGNAVGAYWFGAAFLA
ncbi:MAG: hypothetical protein PWP74_1723, partial [Shewanella sp.]|nr:hypothetical protein [Shewanella sp.]